VVAVWVVCPSLVCRARKAEVLQLFDFVEKPVAFRDFAEKPVVDFEALRQGGFRANPGFFGRIKSLQHFHIVPDRRLRL
jgi:hypothetical protein